MDLKFNTAGSAPPALWSVPDLNRARRPPDSTHRGVDLSNFPAYFSLDE